MILVSFESTILAIRITYVYIWWNKKFNKTTKKNALCKPSELCFFYINKTNEIYYSVLILLGKFYLYTESTKKCDKKSLFSVLKFKKK